MSAKENALKLSDVFMAVQVLLFGLLAGGLIILASKVTIPFVPVQFTLQTFVVVMISLFCEERVAYIGLTSYLLFCGPTSVMTSGYVAGFFLVPVIINFCKNYGRGGLFFGIFASHFVILSLGAVVLSRFLGEGVAIFSGFLFFLPAEVFKAGVSLLLFNRFSKGLK